MYPAEAHAIERADQERVAAEHVETMHRDADALNTIFYKLAAPGNSAGTQDLLQQLESIEANLAITTEAGAKTRNAKEWRDVKAAAAEFIAEGRHVLGPSETTNALLFTRHEKLSEAVARLATAMFADQIQTQKLDTETSRRRVRVTAILLGLALIVAIASAALAVYVTRRVVKHAQWQAIELERLSSRAMSDLDSLSQRLSRELHDHFGQTLSALEANLVAMQNRQRFETGRIEDCLGLTKDAIGNVREVSQLLRPSILDDFGLDASLRWLAEGFSERTGVRVAYESTFSQRIEPNAETQVFRIAQEALTNVGRHSAATEVKIRLRAEGDFLQLSVVDNGRGIAVSGQPERGLGLAGMRARARTAHGMLLVAPGPKGVGVTVLLEVPLAQMEAA
jgi:two-component system NarL family sensor kinase